MARYSAIVESSAAIGAGVNFANVVAAAAANYKLRRATLGVRAGASVPTSQQVTVALFRATARGTATTTATGDAKDPRSRTSGITGVDTAWSVQPTLAAAAFYEASFNTQGTVDLPVELLEEWICDQGTANGICFQNIGNALPASHLITLALEWEE